MMLTILIALASINVGYFGNYLHRRLKTKKTIVGDEHENGADWYYRPILSEPAWEEFKRHIEHDCIGYCYADASIKAVIKHGHRFNCTQIYQLRDIYEKKWPGMRGKQTAGDFLVDITKYHETVVVDADEKTFQLITNTDPKLLEAVSREV